MPSPMRSSSATARTPSLFSPRVALRQKTWMTASSRLRPQRSQDLHHPMPQTALLGPGSQNPRCLRQNRAGDIFRPFLYLPSRATFRTESCLTSIPEAFRFCRMGFQGEDNIRRTAQSGDRPAQRIIHHPRRHPSPRPAYPLMHTGLSAVLPSILLKALNWDGGKGVKIFFVISGFLITDHTLRRWGSLGGINAIAFSMRRACRILPCLLVLLGILAALNLAGAPDFLFHHDSQTLPGAIFAALFMHLNLYEARTNYLPPTGMCCGRSRSRNCSMRPSRSSACWADAFPNCPASFSRSSPCPALSRNGRSGTHRTSGRMKPTDLAFPQSPWASVRPFWRTG